MNPETISEYERSIITNFKFKTKYSPNSLERIAYDKMVSFDNNSDTVESREKAQQWVSELLNITTDAINNIYEIKSDDTKKNKEVLIDQEKMKVLYAMDWVYHGSFLVNADDEFEDKRSGKKRTYGELYPELAFTISVRKIGDKYWFMPQYGIDVNNDAEGYGSYTYKPTLSETLEFINEEMLIVGRNALRDRLEHYFVKRYLERSREKKMNLGENGQQEAMRNASKKVADRINNMIKPDVIEERLYKIRRSTDIFTLPDLIEGFLLDIAAKYLKLARENQYRQIQAQNIQDTEVLDLDGNPHAYDVSQPKRKSLTPPHELNRKIQEDRSKQPKSDDRSLGDLVAKNKNTSVFNEDNFAKANTAVSLDDVSETQAVAEAEPVVTVEGEEVDDTPSNDVTENVSLISNPSQLADDKDRSESLSVSSLSHLSDAEPTGDTTPVSSASPVDVQIAKLNDLQDETTQTHDVQVSADLSDAEESTVSLDFSTGELADYTPDTVDMNVTEFPTLKLVADENPDLSTKPIDEFFVNHYDDDNTEPVVDHQGEILAAVNDILGETPASRLPIRSENVDKISSDVDDILAM